MLLCNQVVMYVQRFHEFDAYNQQFKFISNKIKKNKIYIYIYLIKIQDKHRSLRLCFQWNQTRHMISKNLNLFY